ncbi:MAG: glycosyltransferase family 2 protein [Parvibaculaceae bacterium]
MAADLTDRTSTPSVVAIVVAYNGCRDLDDCLTSLQASTDGSVDLRIVIVDNHSTDGTHELLRTKYRKLDALLLTENLGYGAGANAGWRFLHTVNWDVDFVCILNQDIVVDAGWLTPLIETFRGNPQAAIIQPQILLKQDPELINNIGLRCHYLGLSYMLGYRSPKLGHNEPPKEIDAASGAALALRRSAFRETDPIFSEDLFMYLEDVELSWVTRCRGFSCFVVPASRVYHQFEPDGFLRNYYFMERNRWILILAHFPLLLLTLVGPALATMELVQLTCAATHGVLTERFRVYGFLLAPKNIRSVFQRRSRAKRDEEMLGRDLICRFAGRIETSQLPDGHVFRILNFAFSAYWALVRVPFSLR